MSYKNADAACTYLCDNPAAEYKKYKCKYGGFKIKVELEEILQELMLNGPMQCGITVYNDFFSYSTGTYV